MNPKFIKIKNEIYSVNLLEKISCYGKTPPKVSIIIDGRSFDFNDYAGYLFCSITTFISGLHNDNYQWHTCFDVDDMLSDGKKLYDQMNEAINEAKEQMDGQEKD